MSPQTNNATAASTGPALPGKRFELPALEFKFGSLTEGTDIPPPLPSPVQEKTAPAAPDTPNARKPQQGGRDVADRNQGNASPSSQLSGGSATGSKRPAEDAPASPTLSSRPASIRRLLSRNNLMHQTHANGDGTEPDGRPQSRGNTSVADSSRKAKRLSGWFGRLRGNESTVSKPASPLSPTSPPVVEDKKPKGPPPPKIPELSKLGVQADSGFGSDLFKDIK